jgi:hypothetical protein
MAPLIDAWKCVLVPTKRVCQERGECRSPVSGPSIVARRKSPAFHALPLDIERTISGVRSGIGKQQSRRLRDGFVPVNEDRATRAAISA